MQPRNLPLVGVMVAALTLAACGGSSGSPGDDRAPPDPSMARLVSLVDGADTLVLASLHSRYALSAEGMTVSESLVETMVCEGARCVAEDGTVTTVQDLVDPSADLGSDTDVTRGMRDGFETVTLRSAFEVSETVPGITLTVVPEVFNYGFWGEHGFAAVTLGAGQLSGLIEGAVLSGDFATAMAFAAGNATDSNPAGTGSATWRGIAEAASTRTFERHQGTATVTIADLAHPRVGVAINMPGHDIGAPGWADMELSDGRFAAGTAGSDYLAGDFHGPDHDEAWGVFDTSQYVGAFGVQRQH